MTEVQTAKATFTPGPWDACGHSRKEGVLCVCGQVWSTTADHPVATVERGKWGDTYPAIRVAAGIGGKAEAYLELIEYGEISADESQANARLIAAAPELYEALKALKEAGLTFTDEGRLEAFRLAWTKAANAIAKVEGPNA